MFFKMHLSSIRIPFPKQFLLNSSACSSVAKLQAVLFTSVAVFFSANPVFGETLYSITQEGASHYEKQEFNLAEEKFTQANQKQPENPELIYNLANSHYKNGNYQQALQGYSQVASNASDKALKHKSIYNTGNSLFNLGKLQEAANAYKKSLEMDPRDMDAKFNLEFVLQEMKKQQQQKQNPSSGQDKNKSSNKNNSPADFDPQEDQRPGNKSQSPSQLPPKTKPNQDQKSKSTLKQKTQGEDISKQEAERRLTSLNEDLKKFSRKQAENEKSPAHYSPNDW
jgi:Ca-activated chloride channel family protein